MSIQYAGDTNIKTTFSTTSGRRREIIDNVAAKLANAGWSYISGFGQNTGDVLLESTATPSAANEIRVRIQDSGSGKTMLAKRLPGILPALDFPEALETTHVHNVAGTLAPNAGLLHERPFRAPHHTDSDAGLLGGGIGIPRPDEVSLARNGVLFLYELPVFPRNVLELLRQLPEDGAVMLARSQLTLTLPARFMLVAAMNPCPCGYQLTQPHTRGTDGAASRLSNWKKGTC